jgi:hypothetical protein
MGTYSPLPDDDPHYTIIGRVAVKWAVLEALIDGAIAFLASCGEKEMTCVTAQLIGPAKRMDALIALLTHTNGSDDLRKQLKNFQGRIQQLGEDRNRVVHDPLFLNKDSGFVHKLLATAKGQLKYSFDPVSKKQMEAVADAIHAAGQEFLTLKALIREERKVQVRQQIVRHAEALRGRNPPDGSPSGSVPPA